MPKRTATFERVLPARDPETPAYRWLYQSLRAEILEGRLRSGGRLPGTRDLARQYGLSRGTIVTAFDQLKAEGYVEGSVGSGTYVSQVLPDELLQVSREPGRRALIERTRTRHISNFGQRLDPFPALATRPARAFRANVPALNLFPAKLWTQITIRRMRRVSTNLLRGCDPLGFPPLRAAVADYLNTSRGVKCAPDQIAIVSGVQEALDLIARLCLNPGDRVCMEDPGYIGASFVFRAAGARIVPMPLDQQGMQVRKEALRRARLVYVTPSHQFPLGMTMSLARRLELLEWARKSNGLIVEDDYDSEYRYSGRPVPALQGLDGAGQVLFVGSFSKVLFPALRLGYMVIPKDLVRYFDAAKSLTTRHAPVLDQAVLSDFITAGHFGRHIRRMREIYAERLAVLLDVAREKLTGLLELSSVEAGLQTAGWLAPGIDAPAAVQAATARGLEVTLLSRFSRKRMMRDGLQLGFAAVDPAEIRRGVRELAIALETARQKRA